MGKISIVASFLVLFVSCCFAQDFSVNITYTRGERSTDSRKQTEKISISGKNADYSNEYFGKNFPYETDELKKCDLTDEMLKTFKESVYDNHINQSELIYGNSRKEEKVIFYLDISVSLIVDSENYNIHISGDATEVMQNKIYLNVIRFIKELRDSINKC